MLVSIACGMIGRGSMSAPLWRPRFARNCSSFGKSWSKIAWRWENPIRVTDFFVPSPTVQIMPELMDRIGLLKSETIKAVTAAYLVIGQSRRELLILGAETLHRQDNDQLWLPIKYGPTLIRMNTAKAEYVTNALKTLPPYLE